MGDLRIRRSHFLGFGFALQGYIYWFYGYFLAGVLLVLYRLIGILMVLKIVGGFWHLWLFRFWCVQSVWHPWFGDDIAVWMLNLSPGMSNLSLALANFRHSRTMWSQHCMESYSEGDTQPVFTVIPWGFGLIVTVLHPKTRWTWGLALLFIGGFSGASFWIGGVPFSKSSLFVGLPLPSILWSIVVSVPLGSHVYNCDCHWGSDCH